MWLKNSSQVAVDQYPAAQRGVRNSAAAAAAGGGGGSKWELKQIKQRCDAAKDVVRGPRAGIEPN
jgi:hypothetical protein